MVDISHIIGKELTSDDQVELEKNSENKIEKANWRLILSIVVGMLAVIGGLATILGIKKFKK